MNDENFHIERPTQPYMPAPDSGDGTAGLKRRGPGARRAIVLFLMAMLVVFPLLDTAMRAALQAESAREIEAASREAERLAAHRRITDLLREIARALDEDRRLLETVPEADLPDTIRRLRARSDGLVVLADDLRRRAALAAKTDTAYVALRAAVDEKLTSTLLDHYRGLLLIGLARQAPDAPEATGRQAKGHDYARRARNQLDAILTQVPDAVPEPTAVTLREAS